jgi:anti-sigma regulatory factor (Ser/Thr protein kinase)
MVSSAAWHQRRDPRASAALGIELVRLLMDEFRHEYADGCNVLTLRKRC